MNALLAENHFSTLLSRKKPTYSVMRFLKNHDIEKKRKKQFLNQEFQIRNRFWNRFFTTHQTLNQEFQNMSHFQSTLNNSSFLESEFCSMSNFETSFLPHVRFWSEFLRTQQIFTWNWFWKRNISWTICFQIIFQHLSEFKSTLSNSSVFGSELLQRVSFRIKLLTPCRFLLRLSALRKNLSQDFYNASDFDEKTVFRSLKLLEKLLPKKMFSFKKENLDQNFWI